MFTGRIRLVERRSIGRLTGEYCHRRSTQNRNGYRNPTDALLRLEGIYAKLGDTTPLVLHGTHPLSDDLVRVARARGVIKMNQNRNVRLGYHDYLEKNVGTAELTELQVRGVEEYSKGIERMMVEVFDSAGKA